MLDDRHRVVLRAFCDALIPGHDDGKQRDSLLSATSYTLNAVDSVEKGLARLSPWSRRIIARILLALDSRLVSLLWIGRPVRFSRLPVSRATRLLESMSTSQTKIVRRAFDVLKRVVLLQAYGSTAAQRTVWSDRGYHLVRGDRAASMSRDTLPDRCETLVIGSGAGGAVAAARLAEMGHEVVVLEKGPEVSPSAMDGIEAHAMGEMFEQGGLLTTADGGMSLFAGSCLGGGTTVNWSAAFRIPEATRLRWARFHGIDWMGGGALSEAYRMVETRTSVGVDAVEDNAQNAALRRGCEALGLAVDGVPRNTRGCRGSAARACGRCGLGCAHGRKQGMAATFLCDLKEHGGRIVTGAQVDRIETDRGRVVGAEVHISGPDGMEIRQIRADRIVLAAGALHTPVILMRSGILHDQVGRNLSLHPTVGVAGRYTDPIRGWEGPIMSAHSDAFAAMDGPWGVRIETPPIYPGLLASALPWNQSRVHREDLAMIDRTAAFIVLTRDRSTGRVGLDPEGNLRVRYRISDPDLAAMLTGVIEAARIHLAAGAETVLFPHSVRKVLDALGGDDRMVDLAREIFTWGWSPGLYPLFSAHQMGTCRMGGDARAYPVDPEGRFRGVKGLCVSDASLFPEASGVNPALTVQAIAYVVAAQIR
ncbi:MAG TPA: GMC family oxidoreductase [Rhodothermales bacterium]|nr:GMC family oxidoreductase [Rhodothermales bacterium]